MAKEEKKKPRVHYCRRVRHEPDEMWYTTCGLKLTKAERKDVVLAEEWDHVTCKACKEAEPQ